MSGSHMTSKNIAVAEFYELASDVKAEIADLEEKREIFFGGPRDELGQQKRESNLTVESYRDTVHTHSLSGNDGADITGEKYGTEDNWTSDRVDDLDIDATMPAMNLKPLTPGFINSGKNEFSQFYLDLLQCDRDCVVCKDYIRKFSEHIRASHAADQLTRDPLDIDPLEMDQSSAIEIKCEVDVDIDRIDCSEEFGSSFESYGVSDGDGVSDPNYYTSPDLAGTDHRRGSSSSQVEKKSQSKINNGKKSLKCKECDKSFTRKSSLTVHMMNHTDETLFKCEQCPSTFKKEIHLTIHLRNHTGDGAHKCEVCGKCFKKSNYLSAHLKIHTEEKPFTCEECGKSFRKKTGLTDHMLTHTAERPFQCGQCPSSFKTKAHLTIHFRSHTGERPYKCEACDKRFGRLDTLYVHRKKSCRNKV